MALTRPSFNQINSTVTSLNDPLTVINKSATSASQDLGFIFNRDGGATANVAIVWDETNDQFVLVNTSSSGATNANVTISGYADAQVNQLQADLIKNREQRYTTSNMMKFNQLYTGAAAGSYFTQNEYQKIVTIIPAGNSENYQVSGRILCQNAGEIQTINFKAALRSGDPLPDLSWSITYDQEHNGTAHFKPQLWTKETTTAGFIFAIQKISSGTLYGTVTVDLDIIPRTSSLLDNVTVNTTQDSEQTSIDSGYTARDMTLVKTVDSTDTTFSGNTSSIYFIGDGSQLTNVGAGASYGNTEVGTFLETYNGALLTVSTANIGQTGFTNETVTQANVGLKGYTDSQLAGAGGITYTAGANAPSSPSTGDQWYDTDTDILYHYINDGTSSYWVDIASEATFDVNSVTTNGNISQTETGAINSQSEGNYATRRYVLHGETTDASEVEIFVGGVSNSRIPIATDTTVTADAIFTARRTDTTGHSAGFKISVVADNFSGTTADVGSVYEITVADDSGALAVDAQADDTTDSLKILVQGEASKNISWMCVVTTVEVSQ